MKGWDGMGDGDDDDGGGDGGIEEEVEGWWKISTMKVPPVEGCRATSPRLVEKVERSSWANFRGYGKVS